MRTTISSKGQIVFAAELREIDNIQPGQEFDVERLDGGDYRLVRGPAPHNEGVVNWLLACPHKDFLDLRVYRYWLRAHEHDIAVDPVILGELRFGILILPKGKRRAPPIAL